MSCDNGATSPNGLRLHVRATAALDDVPTGDPFQKDARGFWKGSHGVGDPRRIDNEL